MRILLVSLSNEGGGAAKLVKALHFNLLNRNIDSHLIVFEGKPDIGTTVLLSTLLKKRIFYLKNFLANKLMSLYKNRSHDLRSINIFPSNLLRKINSSNADIVHLHWVGAEMISIEQLKKINKKIVWSLHDAWVLNGSYHINPNDYLGTPRDFFLTPDSSNFLERTTLFRKKKAFKKKNIVFTSPSNWIKKKFDHSFLHNGVSRCEVVPNFLNLDQWTAIDKQIAREKIGIGSRKDKTYIIFGANNAKKSFNKGYHILKDLIKALNPDQYVLIIFGAENNRSDFSSALEVYEFGRIKDQKFLNAVYAAGNIMIVPSLSESFSMVSLESISCGTPVLAFSDTGAVDIIRHTQNGYLAEKENISTMLEGLHWLTTHTLKHIDKTVDTFSEAVVIPQFVNIYKELISNNG